MARLLPTVGTAGATLLALLSVAVSLGTGFLTEERRGATRTFMSPVVIHFTSVFFLSAVALFPSHQAKFFAALIGALDSPDIRRRQLRATILLCGIPPVMADRSPSYAARRAVSL